MVPAGNPRVADPVSGDAVSVPKRSVLIGRVRLSYGWTFVFECKRMNSSPSMTAVQSAPISSKPSGRAICGLGTSFPVPQAQERAVLLALRPRAGQGSPGRLHVFVGGAGAFGGKPQIVEAVFEGQDAEVHFLVQELDEAILRPEGRSIPMGWLPENNDPPIATVLSERRQIRERLGRPINRIERNDVLLKIGDLIAWRQRIRLCRTLHRQEKDELEERKDAGHVGSRTGTEQR